MSGSVHTEVYNQPVADASLIACLHCDLLQHLPEIAPGGSARLPAMQQRAMAPPPRGLT